METEISEVHNKIRHLPHRPGVYLYKDRLGRIIYVGKARDLNKRVSQYFHPSRRMTADLKTRALVESIWDVETHEVKSEAEALLLESKLIKDYRPKFNISFKDDKRFLMVKVNLHDPIPRFQFARIKKEDGSRYFGPFVHSTSLRNSLNLIKKKFGLRSCRTPIPDETDYKHCLDHVIRNCSAPCILKINHADYRSRVQQACEFLEGTSKEMLASVQTDMQLAAERLDFEKAAQLRDLVEDLQRTTKPMKRFLREFTPNLHPQQDIDDLGKALDLPEPPHIMECFDISNISTTHKVASMVCFKEGRPDRSNYRKYRIQSVEGQDDFASMAEVVHRRYRRVLTEGIRQPNLIIVDGGKGQLSAALRELKGLGLGHVPIIGLAKENEEIYRPGTPGPLILDKSSGALRLLQRIRNEAHRVANGYHQLLMKQRISESILDDCPGISESRKRTLFQHFTSIDKLKKATLSELAAIEGIGPKLAQNILQYLSR